MNEVIFEPKLPISREEVWLEAYKAEMHWAAHNSDLNGDELFTNVMNYADKLLSEFDKRFNKGIA